MSCTRPDMEKLINQYQFGFLPDDQKIKVEAHLLECEECLKELYRMSPTLELLNSRPEFFLDSLKPRKTLIAKVTGRIKQPIQVIKKTMTRLASLIILWWKRPIIKILVPVAVTTCVLLFLLLPSPKQYADLAILEKSPYETLRFKGPEELTPVQKIFKSALELYEKNDYTEAIPKFLAFLAYEPENSYGHFYLGVTLFLTSHLDSSMKHLEITTQLSDKQDNKLLLEKSYWHLGNLYLKINDEEKALKTFRTLLELEGSFEEKARKQIDRIIKMKSKKSRD